jgi:bacterioferritin
MRGDADILRALNHVLTNELTSINQYFLHARMYQNWGFERLGKKVYAESIGEMRHADAVIKRILLLEGFPNLQDLHKLSIGESVPEGLEADLAAELRGRLTLVEGIAACEKKRDYVTRDLFTHILDDTEEHIDFLETELGALKAMGVQNYLQSQYSLDREAD